MSSEIVLPDSRFDFAAFGELVSDPSRVTMLLSLMDGRARPATELAQLAKITRQTASSHLHRLVEGGLLSVQPEGRHRFFRLANERVADALETISLLHAPWPQPLAQSPARQELARARTCYHHLAGSLGVAWLSSLERTGFLRVRDGAFALSKRGIAWTESVGMGKERWPAGKSCLDWTDRRNHLGGPLGATLTECLFGLGWIVRRKESRVVRVTARGERELARQFVLNVSDL